MLDLKATGTPPRGIPYMLLGGIHKLPALFFGHLYPLPFVDTIKNKHYVMKLSFIIGPILVIMMILQSLRLMKMVENQEDLFQQIIMGPIGLDSNY